jgi:hypothetical protein
VKGNNEAMNFTHVKNNMSVPIVSAENQMRS